MTKYGILLSSYQETKTMPVTKKSASHLLKTRLLIIALAIIGLVVGGTPVRADQYDDKINALEQQNSSAQSLVDGLQSQAASYQDAINQLQSQIASLQAALTINQNKQASDEQQITSDQNNLNEQKQLLGDEIRSLYMDGQMTTIEELATSKSLSDYIDKEAYNEDIQSNIDSLIGKISSEEQALQKQKLQLTILINTQTQQSSQLSSDQSQQQNLLAMDQSQQNSYNQQIQSNQSQIAVLRQEQIVANEKLVTKMAVRLLQVVLAVVLIQLMLLITTARIGVVIIRLIVPWITGVWTIENVSVTQLGWSIQPMAICRIGVVVAML